MAEPHDALVTLWTSGDETERREALAHVRACAACREAAPKVGVALDALEGGTVGRTEAPPPGDGLARLMRRAREGRLTYFEREVAAMFDLDVSEASALLARLERGEFDAELAPGVQVLAFAPGPRLAGAMTGLVKVAPGAVFPEHPHEGDERVLVLEGGYRDSQGVEVWRGEEQAMRKGTAHFFTAFDVGCVCASLVKVDGA